MELGGSVPARGVLRGVAVQGVRSGALPAWLPPRSSGPERHAIHRHRQRLVLLVRSPEFDSNGFYYGSAQCHLEVVDLKGMRFTDIGSGWWSWCVTFVPADIQVVLQNARRRPRHALWMSTIHAQQTTVSGFQKPIVQLPTLPSNG